MSSSLGKISAKLAETSEDTVPAGLVELLNRNIDPPEALGEDEVYIRAMYVVSDQINSYGGCFPIEEHPRLVELMVDSPVIVGHRKDKLPVGRCFHAVVEQRAEQSWVKSYFYWLRSADGAHDLKENIDGGIYKECSIGFTFLFPECSVCGRDIRECEHQPGEEHEVEGEKAVCYFNYRQVERVLETSLVYRGAVPDTSISKDLAIGRNPDPATRQSEPTGPKRIKSTAELDPHREYLVVPSYECVPVLATLSDGRMTLNREDGTTINQSILDRFEIPATASAEKAYAHLVGYRGKERCSVKQLQRFLGEDSGPVSRLELMLFPHESLVLPNHATSGGRYSVRIIRHEINTAGAVSEKVRRLATRAGVRLWPIDSLPPDSPGLLYDPPQDGSKLPSCYWLSRNHDDNATSLIFRMAGVDVSFVLRQFNLSRLEHGARFVAERTDAADLLEVSGGYTLIAGSMDSCRRSGAGIQMTLKEPLAGNYVLRPSRLKGRRVYLFYRQVG